MRADNAAEYAKGAIAVIPYISPLSNREAAQLVNMRDRLLRISNHENNGCNFSDLCYNNKQVSRNAGGSVFSLGDLFKELMAHPKKYPRIDDIKKMDLKSYATEPMKEIDKILEQYSRDRNLKGSLKEARRKARPYFIQILGIFKPRLNDVTIMDLKRSFEDEDFFVFVDDLTKTLGI